MIFYAIFNSIKSFKPPSVWGYLMRCATLTESPMSCYSKYSDFAEIARSPNGEGPRAAGTPRCHRGGSGGIRDTLGRGGNGPGKSPAPAPGSSGTEAARGAPAGPPRGLRARCGPGQPCGAGALPFPSGCPRSLGPVVSKASPSKLPSNFT